MIELVRCPNCSALYNMKGINLLVSQGWVQCCECNSKFKANSCVINKSEINDQIDSNYQALGVESKFTDKKTDTLNIDTMNNAKKIEYFDKLDEELISSKTGNDSDVDFSERLMTLDNHRELKDTFEQSDSGVKKVAIQPVPSKRDWMSLENELEASAGKYNKPRSLSKKVSVILAAITSSVVTLVLVAIFLFQLQSRGTINVFPDDQYGQLLNATPYLNQFEKSQTDLSSLHLESTRMEKNAAGLSIVLKLVNRSSFNQAYPDFQLEFTDAKGEVIARTIVLPNMYLEKGHLGLLEAREAKTVFLNLASLPKGSKGYQIKVVQQSS